MPENCSAAPQAPGSAFAGSEVMQNLIDFWKSKTAKRERDKRMSLDLNILATSRPVNHGPLDLCNAINAWFRGSDVGIISSALNAEKGNCLAANGREEDKPDAQRS